MPRVSGRDNNKDDDNDDNDDNSNNNNHHVCICTALFPTCPQLTAMDEATEGGGHRSCDETESSSEQLECC